MKKIKYWIFLLLIPLRIIIGKHREEYLINLNNLRGTPNMQGGLAFYAFSFLGFYLAIALIAFSYVAESDMNKIAKGIVITIEIIISVPILFFTYFFL